MRTEKELFELMLKHQEFFGLGLCCWVAHLWVKDIINYDEERLLRHYLDKNRPKYARRYWWGKGKIQPRLDWINEQIEKL